MSKAVSEDDRRLIDKQWGRDRRVGVVWNSLNRQTRPMGEKTGDIGAGSWGHLWNKYVPKDRPLKVLSPCCGIGWLELWVNKSCRVERIDAFDVSPSAIETAKANAAAAGVDCINYFVADGNVLDLGTLYDLIVISGGLHHINDLEGFCATMRDHLKPDGVMIASEYVGPSYTQYTPRQVELINACITLLPEKYRNQISGSRLTRYQNMTVEQWLEVDPSESIRSADIVDVVRSTFGHVDLIDRGGAIVHMALFQIAHNFDEDDPEDANWLDLLYKIEDAAMAAGEVPMCWADFAAKR